MSDDALLCESLVEVKGNFHRTLNGNIYTKPQKASLYSIHLNESKERKYLIAFNNFKFALNSMMDMTPKCYSIIEDNLVYEPNVITLTCDDGKYVAIRPSNTNEFCSWQTCLGDALAEVICLDAVKDMKNGRISINHITNALTLCSLLTPTTNKILIRTKHVLTSRLELTECLQRLKVAPHMVSYNEIIAIISLAKNESVLLLDQDYQFLLKLESEMKRKADITALCQEISLEDIMQDIPTTSWARVTSMGKSDYDYTFHATATVDTATSRHTEQVIQIVDVTTSPTLVASTVVASSNDSSNSAALSIVVESAVETEVIASDDASTQSSSMNTVAQVAAVVESKSVESDAVKMNNDVRIESVEDVPIVASKTNNISIATHGNIKALPKITENVFVSNGVSTPKRRILHDTTECKIPDITAASSSENVSLSKGVSDAVSAPKRRILQDLDVNKIPDSNAVVHASKAKALSTEAVSMHVAPVASTLATSSAVVTTAPVATINDTSSGVFAPLMAKRKLMKSPVRWSTGPMSDSSIVTSVKVPDVITKLPDSRNLDDSIGHYVSKYKWHILGGVGCIVLFTIILIIIVATAVSVSSTYYVVSHNQYPSNPQVHIDHTPQYKQANPIYTPQQQDIIMQEFQNILSNPSYGLMDYGGPLDEKLFHKQHLPKLANLLRQTIVKIIYSPVWFIGNSVKAAWNGINHLFNLKKNV